MNDDLYQEALRRRKTLTEDLEAIEAELRSLEISISMWEKRLAHTCSSFGSILIGSGKPPVEIEAPLLRS